MQDKIGLVIAKGLSVVYKEKPENPVDFFAKWLLQQSSIKKREQQERDIIKNIQNLKKKDELDAEKQAKAKQETENQKKKMNDKIDKFNFDVDKSDDLNDQLQSLVDHLAEFTGATACYVGKIAKPIKGVS